MKRLFSLLAVLIFFNSCAPVFAQTQTFWGNVNVEGSLDVIINATVSKLLSGNGTVSAPAVTFANDSASGIYLIGTGEVAVSAGGARGIDVLNIGGGLVNLGFGSGANAVAAGSSNAPITMDRALNGGVFYSMGNSNCGTNAYSAFVFSSGSASATFENHNCDTGSYVGGNTVTTSGQFNPGYIFAANSTSSPFFAWDLAGVGSAKEVLRLNSSGLNFNGSSSGVVTIATQAAAGTYNFNLPTSAGSSGQPMISGGGSGSPMTFGTLGVAGGGTGIASTTAYAPVVGGTTTTGAFQSASSGISNVGWVLTSTGTSSVPTWQAQGTPSFSGLTANALAYASSTTTIASLGSAGTSGQILMSNGSGSAPSMQTLPGNSTILKAPTLQTFTSTGSATGYLFTVSTTTTCALGDTYTNNSVTFTVLAALAAQSGQVLFMSASGAPQTSGTLTRATGSGTSSVTFTAEQAMGTYTLPSGPAPLYLRIRMAGGGGGGSGSSSGSGTASSNGLTSTFGTNLMIATAGSGGGTPGALGGTGGSGGTATLNAGPLGMAINGGDGSNGASASTWSNIGTGGVNPFGGAGRGGATSATGMNGKANTGAGGGGGGPSGSIDGGGSGGAGAYIDAIITSPASTYFYSVGTGGTGATGATGGGNGAAGVIYVEEHYQ